MAGHRGWAAAAALMVAIAGCGGPDRSESKSEPEPSPQEALAALEEASEELLTTLGPNLEYDGVGPNAAVPCGGFGGSGYSRISLDHEGGLRVPATDPRLPQGEELFERAETILQDMGLKVVGRQRTPAGDGLVFGGEGFGGKLLLHVEGAVMVRGQTACLPNVDDLR